MRIPVRIPVVLLSLVISAAAPAATAPERTLTIIDREGLLAPAIIQAFEKREHAKVVEIHAGTVGDSVTLAQEQAGRADLITGSMLLTQQLKARELLQKIDRAKLRNVGDTLPQFQIDPDHVVPFLWTYTGLGWRTDLVRQPVDSYAKLLALARHYPGRVMLSDDNMEFAHAVLLMYGNPPYNYDDLAALKEALALYRAEGEKLFRIQAPVADNTWPLDTGEAIGGMVHNNDVDFHRGKFKAQLEYAQPAAGCFVRQENFMLLADAPQPALAHAFLDYINDGKVAARNAEAVRLASANPDAADDYSKDFLKNPYIRPRLEGTTGCRVNKPLSIPTQKFIDALVPTGIDRH